jgi:hypothetical protein
MLPDETVRALGKPVSVAKLTVEHPCHFAVWTRALSPLVLQANDGMHTRCWVYVMLPSTLGRVSCHACRLLGPRGSVATPHMTGTPRSWWSSTVGSRRIHSSAAALAVLPAARRAYPSSAFVTLYRAEGGR